MSEGKGHTKGPFPWAGQLRIDLRRESIADESLAFLGVAMFDDNNERWLIALPTDEGSFDHLSVIQRALNSHETLVAALKLTLCELSACANQLTDLGRNVSPDGSVGRAIVAARSALRAAQGETRTVSDNEGGR